jgi:L-asparaginase
MKGMAAVDATTALVGKLEALPDFNAGKGAFLQNDGQARLSASLMDGEREVFSGVHLATHLIHPSVLCRELQNRKHTVFGPLGAQHLARELGMAPESPVTLAEIDRWRSHQANKDAIEEKGGTVGAVVLDTFGNLAAATSTGGDVSNPPERMSDSATVAANYASKFAAISCTGIGEQIVNDAVAARLETRVRDGRNIIEASQLGYQEAQARTRSYGWIALDTSGNWAACNLCEDMCVAMMTAQHSEPEVIRD